MKKNVLMLLIFFITHLASAQGGAQNTVLLQEVNRDIWLPFIEGVNTGRDDLYTKVHSQQFYWVAGGKKPLMMNRNEYDDDSRKVMSERHKNGDITKMDVRFLERSISSNCIWEKCIFSYEIIKKGKSPQVFYSISQVFSRKENGAWKMCVQYVSNEPADEAMFKSAARLDKVDW